MRRHTARSGISGWQHPGAWLYINRKLHIREIHKTKKVAGFQLPIQMTASESPAGPENPDSPIQSLIRKQEELYKNSLKLIVSENRLSPAVRAALSSDFAGRYDSEWYGGTKYADEVIHTTTELAKKVFRSKFALVTPLSGNFCDLAAVLTFSEPGNGVAMMDREKGGYPFGWQKFSRRFVPLPTTDDPLNLDAARCVEKIREERPALTLPGTSTIPFPHPVKDIAHAAREVEIESREGTRCGRCVFDGSHVLGLIASGAYPHPLDDGAEVLIGSTHKSFYGPQGGIVLTNHRELHESLRKFLEFDFEGGIGLVDNPHVHRIASLGAALEEMLTDRDYGMRVVKNTKALGRALHDLGVPVKFGEHGFSETHQLLLNMESGDAKKYCHNLERIGIFIDVAGRVGTAELTHCGFGGEEMENIAGIMAALHSGKGDIDELKKKVTRLAENKKI